MNLPRSRYKKSIAQFIRFRETCAIQESLKPVTFNVTIGNNKLSQFGHIFNVGWNAFLVIPVSQSMPPFRRIVWAQFVAKFIQNITNGLFSGNLNALDPLFK